MENDRELLEYAAKAAELDVRWVKSWNSFYIHVPHKMPIEWPKWNPITDDGDALRLAVKLGLDVCIDSRHENEPHTHVIGFPHKDSAQILDAIEDHGDPCAATRRAIVRAAAEIGKAIG